MKKFVSVSVILGMLMTLSVVASVASDGVDQPTKPKHVATGKAAINGQLDKRVITPDMNWREKVETQRNIRKRAAAMRNQLMVGAELERQNQPKPIRTAPIVQ